MPAPVIVQNQINTLETGLKQLKASKLMNQEKFRDMYGALEKHHREVRLAHLTGTCKDRIQQGQQDTQFFYILVKMLSEVTSCHVNHQRENLDEVYNWFIGNSHVLHTAPLFGRQKKQAKHLTERPHLKMGNTPRKGSQVIQDGCSEKSGTIEFPDSLSERTEEKEPTRRSRPTSVTFADSTKPEASSLSETMTRSDSMEQLVPQKKAHPLTHLVNPHSGGIVLPGEEGTPRPDSRQDTKSPSEISTPVRFYVDSRASTPRSTDGRPIATLTHKTRPLSNMSKWDCYKQDASYGQDLLGQLQLMGRLGTPFGVRYTAHDQALMAEEFTPDIISEYASKNTGTQHGRGGSILPNAPLEEFYELSQRYYPHKLPKYPSFGTATKPKSAPPGVRTGYQNGADRTKEAAENDPPPLDVKLNSLVSIIDSVTDEMVSYKEKLIPEPQPGFRQPTVGVEPTSPSLHPDTAPMVFPGSEARPSSPELLGTESRQELSTVVNAVDWRGKVAPDPTPSISSEAGFSSHTYIKKQQRPQSSLRTAGSTSAGRRPKTAPVSSKEKWKVQKAGDEETLASSQDASAAEPENMDNLITVQHLGGTSKKRRARFSLLGTKYYYDEDSESASTSPNLQYLSFITPKFIQGGRAHSAPAGQDIDRALLNLEQYREHFEDTNDTELLHNIIIPGLEPESFQGSNTRDTDSISPDLDMGDLEQDLEEQAEHGSQAEEQADNSLTQQKISPDVRDQSYKSLPVTPQKDELDRFARQVHKPDKDIHSYSKQTLDITNKSGKVNRKKIEIKDNHYYSAAELIGEINELVRQSNGNDGTEHANDNVEETGGNLEKGSNSEKTNVSVVRFQSDVEKEERHEHTDDGHQRERHRVNIKSVSGSPYGVSGITFSSEEKPKVSKPKTYITRPRLPKKPTVVSDSENNETSSDEPSPRKQQQGANAAANDLNIVKYIEELKTSPRSKSAGFAGRKPLNRPTVTPKVLKSQPFEPDESDSTMLKVQGQNQSQGASRRSVGRVPDRAQSATPLSMLRKQQEMLRRAPAMPYRTAPSIPGPHSPFGTRSPGRGQVYSIELEAHARKDRSPRHYMQKVDALRKSHSDIGVTLDTSTEDAMLTSVLRVNRLSRRQQDSPVNMPTPPVTPDLEGGFSTAGKNMKKPTYIHIETGHVMTETLGPRSLTQIGRPIAHYLEVNDPDQYAEAVRMQKEAKAAVDIQRCFRGYVARNHYKYLQKEERELREDKQKAAIEIQRAYRRHLLRTQAIERRPPQLHPETLEWAKEYKRTLVEREHNRQAKAFEKSRENARNHAEASAKLSVIGPHVDIYQHFHPKKTGPEKSVMHRAATAIQRWVRGHLVRQRIETLKRKAKVHGMSYSRFVGQYKELIRRVQGRRGIERPQEQFSFQKVMDFMDTKKNYENVFDQKAFGGELDLSELPEYFQECDLYPSKLDIQEGLDLVFRGRPKKGRGLNKGQTMELTFQIYPPDAAGMADVRKSTWMSPIIDGEEAIKMMGTDNVEETNYKACFQLVAGSIKERKERARQEAERREEEEEQRKEQERKEQQRAARKEQKQQQRQQKALQQQEERAAEQGRKDKQQNEQQEQMIAAQQQEQEQRDATQQQQQHTPGLEIVHEETEEEAQQ